MQKKTKMALAATGAALVLTVGAGVGLADGGFWGHGRAHHMAGMDGQMGMMDDDHGGFGPMQGGGMMGHGAMMGMGPGAAIDFAAADTDKDGKLTQAELSAWQQAQVAGIDADKDGKLSVEEIAAFHMARVKDGIETHAKDMVARLDSDGDGLLSASELLARPMAAPAFSALDRNGDGVLTEDELQAPVAPGRAGGATDSDD